MGRCHLARQLYGDDLAEREHSAELHRIRDKNGGYGASGRFKSCVLHDWAKRAQPEDIQKLADAYVSIAQKTGGYVAPVGLAFEKARKAHPEINLYYHDGVHPSIA